MSIAVSLCERDEAQRNFQDFFFSHFPCLTLMSRLKSAVGKAIICWREIAESTLQVQALGAFRRTISKFVLFQG